MFCIVTYSYLYLQCSESPTHTLSATKRLTECDLHLAIPEQDPLMNQFYDTFTKIGKENEAMMKTYTTYMRRLFFYLKI